MSRPTILTLLGCFTEEFAASGPNSSFLRAAATLGDRFAFRVVAWASSGETTGEWGKREGLDRIALASRPIGPRGLRRLLDETPHDLLYLTSFFDRRLSIPVLVMRRFGLIARRPLLLAPNGEFSPGALGLKNRRKRAYLAAARALGLLDGIHFQATSAAEAADIASALPGPRSILIGPNVATLEALPAHPPRQAGEPLRIVALGRIDRMKNIHFAIQCLIESRIAARFDVIGPVTSEVYAAECRRAAAAAPPHLDIGFSSAVAGTDVVPTLARYDLFLSPTLGENYGYAIVEALSAGTPVMISDRTPWAGVAEAGAGTVLPLDRRAPWVEALREFAALDQPAMHRRRTAARHFIEREIDPAASGVALERCLRRAMDPSADAGPAR